MCGIYPGPFASLLWNLEARGIDANILMFMLFMLCIEIKASFSLTQMSGVIFQHLIPVSVPHALGLEFLPVTSSFP